MPGRWDYFPLGPKPEATLEILKLKSADFRQADTKYLVRYDCCGGLTTLSHTQIKNRIRKHSNWCGKCASSFSGHLACKTKAERKKLREAEALATGTSPTAKHGSRVSGGRDFPPAPMPPPWPASKSAQELWKKDARLRLRW